MPSVISIILLIISLISLLINVYILGHTNGYCDGIKQCKHMLEESRRRVMEQIDEGE